MAKRVSVYLLDESFNPAAALSGSEGCFEPGFRHLQSDDNRHMLWWPKTPEVDPFVLGLFPNVEGGPAGCMACVVILVKRSKRWFAISMGSGRYKLAAFRDASIDLEHWAERAPADQVHAVRKRELGGHALATSQSSSRLIPVPRVQADAFEEVRGFATIYDGLGRVSVGLESARILVRPTWGEVESSLDQLWSLLDGPARLETLKLGGAIAVARTLGSTLDDCLVDGHLMDVMIEAPADSEEEWTVGGVALPARLGDLTNATRDLETVEQLVAKAQDGETELRLRELLTTELEYKGDAYVRARGCWYKIPSTTYDHLLEQLKSSTCAPPMAMVGHCGDSESSWLQDVSAATGWPVFDKTLLSLGGTGAAELADIYDEAKWGSCVVKRYKGTANSMAHVVQQASASASLLLSKTGESLLTKAGLTLVRRVTVVLMDNRVKSGEPLPVLCLCGLVSAMKAVRAVGVEFRLIVVHAPESAKKKAKKAALAAK